MKIRGIDKIFTLSCIESANRSELHNSNDLKNENQIVAIKGADIFLHAMEFLYAILSCFFKFVCRKFDCWTTVIDFSLETKLQKKKGNKRLMQNIFLHCHFYL